MLSHTMTGLEERIKLIMDEQGWDIATLARIAGVTHSAASQWLGRGSKPTKSIGDMEVAQRLSVVTGYKPLWIAKGKGDKKQTYPTRGAGIEPTDESIEVKATQMPMPAPVDKTDLILLNLRLLLSSLPADRLDAAQSALVSALVPFLLDRRIP